MLDRVVIHKRLLEATRDLIPFTEEFVFERLPRNVTYRRITSREERTYASAEELLADLWQEDRFPIKVVLNVDDLVNHRTVVNVDIELGYTDDPEKLTTEGSRFPPFVLARPPFPPNHPRDRFGVNLKRKFSIRWRHGLGYKAKSLLEKLWKRGG